MNWLPSSSSGAGGSQGSSPNTARSSKQSRMDFGILNSSQQELNNSMASLNRAFIQKCASTIEMVNGDPSCSLVPIVLSYVKHTLAVILNHEEQHPSDKQLFGFLDNIESSIQKLTNEMKVIRQKHNLLFNINPKAKSTETSQQDIASGQNALAKTGTATIANPSSATTVVSSSSAETIANSSLAVASFCFSSPVSTSTPFPSKVPHSKINLPAVPSLLTPEGAKPTGLFNSVPPTTNHVVPQSKINLPTAAPSLFAPEGANKPWGSGLFNSAPPTTNHVQHNKINLPTVPSLFPQEGAKTLGLFNSVPPTTNHVNSTDNNNDDGEDESAEPPKNEFKPVEETDIAYQTRVKVFEKAGKEFKELGLGTLYVKEITNGHQLFVRAENNLGTLYLNMRLGDKIPLSTTKNHVVTVDPLGNNRSGTTYLIRVKTPADAEALKTKLEEFKAKKGGGKGMQNHTEVKSS